MKIKNKTQAFHSSASILKTTYFFVRHGQTDWNVQGKMQGHTDIPLNDTGRSQAASLKKMLEEIPFSACFSSDLQRASETASIVIADRSLEVIKESRLREFNYGGFEGKSWQEFTQSVSLEQRASIEREKHHHIKTFLAHTAEQEIQGNVLMVTHGGFMSTILTVILDLSLDAADTLSIDNTAFLQMHFTGSEWVIEKTEGIQLPAVK